MNPIDPQALSALTALLGPRLDATSEVRRAHAADASYHAPQPPQAVAFPENVEEVAQIAQICTAHQVPIVPFGTGTAVEGGIVAVRGGLCVDLSRMNRILRVSAADMDATVEAGVTRHQLNEHLRAQDTGLHFPVDPGADASLGGMAATRASGSAAVGYGTMRDNVLGLKAVFADGTIVEVGGRARKSSAGYDLTALLVGTEGTLAFHHRSNLAPSQAASGHLRSRLPLCRPRHRRRRGHRCPKRGNPRRAARIARRSANAGLQPIRGPRLRSGTNALF